MQFSCECGLSAESKRFPNRWKKICGQNVCPTCAKNWRTYAITVPVSGPELAADWPAFREACKIAWSEARALSNWAATELAKADVVRDPAVEKMPKYPKNYLYPAARKRFPDIATGSLTATLASVERKYRAKRYDIIWTGSASLPSYRYPTPYTVASATASLDERDERFFLSLRLGDTRFSLRLAGGHGQKYWVPKLRQLITGQAAMREVSLMRVRDNRGDHRNGTTDRESGGDRNHHFRIVAKIVGMFPAVEKRTGVTMTLVRGGDFFVAATIPDHDVWRLNADHVQRWIEDHRRYLQRMSDDTKHEKRLPKKRRRGMNYSRAERCDKHNRRVDTFVDEATASIAGYASRNNVGTVTYDESPTAFLGGEFPWFIFKEKLKQKLDRNGIDLIVASGEVPAESTDPLADTQGEL